MRGLSAMSTPDRTDAEPSAPRRGNDVRLNPAARVLWRAHDQIQLEIGGTAYVVNGVDTSLLAELTGRDVDTGPSGLPLELVRALSSTQLAWPGATGQHARPPAPRLADELTSLTARFGRRAPATLRARRDRCVAVSGPSKTGI